MNPGHFHRVVPMPLSVWLISSAYSKYLVNWEKFKTWWKQTSSTLYVFPWLFIAMLPNKPNAWNRLVCNTKLSLGYQNYRQKCLVCRTFCFLFWGKYWTKVLRILTKCREVCTNKTKGRVIFSHYCYLSITMHAVIGQFSRPYQSILYGSLKFGALFVAKMSSGCSVLGQ